ncbi:MAG: hypothetical protein R3F56_11885 [Planctomycetota bacterium]
MIKNDATRWAPRAAAPDAEFVGLQAIADALAEIIGLRPDNATVCRWPGRGIRGHRIVGRRIGRRWACTRSALIEWALTTGSAKLCPKYWHGSVAVGGGLAGATY